MNGQTGRQQIIRDLARTCNFGLVIETGTFRGVSTQFLSYVVGARVETIEANARYFEFSRRRFARASDVRVKLGDSRGLLEELSHSAEACGRTTLFYLDAHWASDLPLVGEIEIIARSWKQSVIVIDDFQVPDDSGYKYDEYGVGRALTLSLLPPLPGWTTAFPVISSKAETGAKRGCVVLASPQLGAAVGSVESLRVWRP